MAARSTHEPATLDQGVVVIYGGCTGAGNATPTSVLGAGVSSIAYVSTGKYTITLSDKWNKFLLFSSCVIDTTTEDDWEVVVTAEAVATSKTVSITVFKGGTAADLSTDEKLKFAITVSHTSAPPSAR